ncbi:MAG: methylenetetrahydrofolate--tRNA-(uracil(54)-C(5))-methyltransferase (FADH(2)-oxidizing) TrmFO [Chloroflexi bacterium]|nr:methylenetetrahydrofolate--tRNA-(uracil(54)-C(5))-methyltransferase (FADH(2)-oxidizing) TrmFO [Chloroflexota bacterium]
MSQSLIIIGGGLSGSEAAWQAAQRGISVKLYEMRPGLSTGAHMTADLAELVCSNSLGSNMVDRASGLVKEELRILGSLLIECADHTALPAGGALAVDRGKFSQLVTRRLDAHPRIEVIREEVREIPNGPVIIASGPLTSESLSTAIVQMSGKDHLYFYDAIAPIVSLESINMEVAFRGSRYGRGTKEQGDYINCPMDEDEYTEFVTTLSAAERIELKEFDRVHESGNGVNAGAHKYFEGCLPVEVLARRDQRALAFGPLRPVGLTNPHSGDRPFAVVQLRQDNLAGTLYNLVGFQTNLKFPEQRRVFRMIPGLENAEFLRYGQMHRNTFIYSPGLLKPTMQFKSRPDLFFAGQITGIEGYAGNIASGLLAGINSERLINDRQLMSFPETTMIGALCHYITHADPADYQPMKANFGILPPLFQKKKMNKRQRAAAYSERAIQDLQRYISLEESMLI